MTVRIITGDALSVLRGLESESVNCVVTSPPYYGLRSYGTEPQTWGGDPGHGHVWQTVTPPGHRSSDTKPGRLQHPGNTGRDRLTSGLCPCGAWRGELGHEPTPALFIAHLIEVFEEVRRVLRSDGTCWVVLGDSYMSAKGTPGGEHAWREGRNGDTKQPARRFGRRPTDGSIPGLKPKDLLLIPERFALAAQDAGWWVRSQIVWAKTSCMPEPVNDRPTSSWEPIWLLTKSRTYYFDADAVRQQGAREYHDTPGWSGFTNRERYADVAGHKQPGHTNNASGPPPKVQQGANIRNVWTLGPEPSREEHYAAFPTEIPRRCILAGSRPGDTVLDPFLGSGTTALVADRLGRECIGIELSAEYAEMARRRIEGDETLFSEPVQVVGQAEQLSMLEAL